MEPSELPLILRAIKKTLKTRGLVYRDLAAKMGIPAATLKKMLAAKDLTFRRLEAICRALDLDLADILGSSMARPVHTVTFTPAQEAFFQDDPAAFGFYWQLVIERLSAADIATSCGLSERETFHYLRQFDSLGLLELHAENVVRLPRIRPIRWDLTRPFVQDLARRWAIRTVADLTTTARGSLAVQYFQLQRDSYEELLAMLRDLETEFAKRTARDLSVWQGDMVRVRAVFAVAEGSYIRPD